MPNSNPRVKRDELRALFGKKVTVGTHSYHYISGVLESLNEENELVFTVAGKPLRLPLSDLATISEAPPAQAEYVK